MKEISNNYEEETVIAIEKLTAMDRNRLESMAVLVMIPLALSILAVAAAITELKDKLPETWQQ